MTRDELAEIAKYELPDDILAKLKKYVSEPPGVGEESAVTFEDEFNEIEYTDEVIDDKIIDEDLLYSEELLEEILETTEFPLDDALDSYDPDFPGYSPSKESYEFFTLMRLIEGQDFDFDTPIAHYFMVDLLLGYITDPLMFPYDDKICKNIEINMLRIAFMCSRGVAKSSVVISFFGVYSAIKGKLSNDIGKVWFYLVLAASSRGGARVNALAVRAMCEDSEFLKDHFESMRFTESESEFVRKGDGAKKHRSFLIRYQGVGTGVRGIRYGERRICMIINDDIILNEAAAYSKTVSENLESVMHSDSIAALKGGGQGRIVNCFTPFSYTDVNTQLVLNGAYTPCVIPMARNINIDDPKLKASDVQSTWEAMHPARSIVALIKEAKKTKKIGKFLQERMLRLSSGSDRLIPDSALQFCDMKQIVKNIDSYNVYIVTDYTTTSGEKSDFSARATFAVSNNEDFFMLDLALRKMGMDEQYDGTIDEAERWKRKGKHVQLGVEIDGNQQAHIHSLEKIMLKRGQWFSFAKEKNDPYSSRKGILSKSTGVKKHERFRIASPAILAGKLWLPEHLRHTPDMKEMLSQIKGATHDKFTRSDDGPDLLSMIFVSAHVIFPTDSAPNTVSQTYDGVAARYVTDPFWGDDDAVYGDINGYSSYN